MMGVPVAMRRPYPSQERLRELFFYDPDEGVLRWRVARNWKSPQHSEAGSLAHRYIQIKVDGRSLMAHVIAWIYMTGSERPRVVDHIDGNSTNNKFSNLRAADQSLNMGNSKGRCGHLKGTIKVRGHWRASIFKDGKRIHLGHFDTQVNAHAAYVAKARELFGEFARAS